MTVCLLMPLIEAILFMTIAFYRFTQANSQQTCLKNLIAVKLTTLFFSQSIFYFLPTQVTDRFCTLDNGYTRTKSTKCQVWLQST